MQNLTIDLRGLNYPFFTGVNTVTLHILYQLLQNSSILNTQNLNIYGLNLQRQEQLLGEFAWLKKILGTNQNENFNKIDQISNLLKFYLNISPKALSTKLLINKNGRDTDHTVYQTQPKPLAIPKNSKFITTFHDLSTIKNFNQPNLKQSLQENILSYTKLANRADRIIVNSYSTGYDLLKTLKIPENKLKVVYLALPEWDSLRLQERHPEQQKNLESNFNFNTFDKPYFLALSAFEYRKNYHNLLLAWHILSKSEPSIYNNHNLIICGSEVDPKYLKYLKDLIHKLCLKNVMLLTNITDDQKQVLLKNCLTLVYTSLYEGFGFPILEAQKYRKAVLTSNTSSMPEISGKGALCVNPLDSLQIADGLAILVKDTLFRETLENHAQQNLQRFTWEEYKSSLNEIFSQS